MCRIKGKGIGLPYGLLMPRNIYVAGDFNSWDSRANPLFPVGVSGIWAGFVPDVVPGQMYKFQVIQSDGREVTKTDPFAFRSEMRPGHAAVTWGLENHEWEDEAWMTARRSGGLPLNKPIVLLRSALRLMAQG